MKHNIALLPVEAAHNTAVGPMFQPQSYTLGTHQNTSAMDHT